MLKRDTIIFYVIFLSLIIIISGCEDNVLGKNFSKQKTQCTCTKNVIFKNIKNPDGTFLTQSSIVRVPYDNDCSGLNGYFISNDADAAQWYSNCVGKGYKSTTTTSIKQQNFNLEYSKRVAFTGERHSIKIDSNGDVVEKYLAPALDVKKETVKEYKLYDTTFNNLKNLINNNDIFALKGSYICNDCPTDYYFNTLRLNINGREKVINLYFPEQAGWPSFLNEIINLVESSMKLPESGISTTTTTLMSNDLCKGFMINGDYNKKFNFLFISDGFNNEDDFKDRLNKLLDENKSGSMFTIEPYKSSKNNINIYYLYKSNEEFLDLDPEYPSIKPPKFKADYQTRLAFYCPNLINRINVVITFSKRSFRSHSETIGVRNNINVIRSPVSVSASDIEYLNSEDSITQNTLLHELGHSIAGFGEEYYDQGLFHFRPPTVILDSDLLSPEADVEGCPKWCSGFVNTNSVCYTTYVNYKSCMSSARSDNGYLSCLENADNSLKQLYGNKNPIVDNCDIGKNCLQGTGCYFNAGGVFRFRGAKESIMKHGPPSIGYGVYPTEYFKNLFDSYTTYLNVKNTINNINIQITNYSFVADSNNPDMVNSIIKFRLYNQNNPVILFSDSLKVETVGIDGRSNDEQIYRINSNGEYYAKPALYYPNKPGYTNSNAFLFKIKINLPNFNKETIYEYNAQTNIFRDVSGQQNIYQEQNKDGSSPIVSDSNYNLGVSNK